MRSDLLKILDLLESGQNNEAKLFIREKLQPRAKPVRPIKKKKVRVSSKKWYVDQLDVGEYILLEPTNVKNEYRIRKSVMLFGKNTGRIFKLMKSEGVMKFTRIV